MSLLRELARPYLAAAPAGVSVGEEGGVTERLVVRVAADHAPGLIEVAWSNFTLGRPTVSASCAAQPVWDPSSSRLSLAVPAAMACQIELSAP